jgi:hypothetical protein
MTAPTLLVALVALLACAAAAPGAAQPDCFADPSQAACAGFTVDAAALNAELDQACASAGSAPSGWPSACTLLAECRAGRAAAAYCAPLRLARTACQEQASLSFCARCASPWS